MKVEINGVDVTNDCVVKEDTIIFYGTRWFDGFKLPVESPSPTASSDKPVVGKSKEQLEILADEIANKNLRYGGDEPAEYNAYVNGIKDGLTYNVDQALPVVSDAVDKKKENEK